MADTFATIIVTAAQAQAARDAAAQFPGGEGMLTAPLSASGNEPATHYVSSGHVSADIAEAVKPLCSTYAEDADGLQVIADAGLSLCGE